MKLSSEMCVFTRMHVQPKENRRLRGLKGEREWDSETYW